MFCSLVGVSACAAQCACDCSVPAAADLTA